LREIVVTGCEPSRAMRASVATGVRNVYELAIRAAKSQDFYTGKPTMRRSVFRAEARLTYTSRLPMFDQRSPLVRLADKPSTWRLVQRRQSRSMRWSVFKGLPLTNFVVASSIPCATWFMFKAPPPNPALRLFVCPYVKRDAQLGSLEFVEPVVARLGVKIEFTSAGLNQIRSCASNPLVAPNRISVVDPQTFWTRKPHARWKHSISGCDVQPCGFHAISGRHQFSGGRQHRGTFRQRFLGSV
jgi:hypothetical protein